FRHSVSCYRLLSTALPTLSVARFFFLHVYWAHRDLHSFPTRRSSDLERDLRGIGRLPASLAESVAAFEADEVLRDALGEAVADRSEEHTSELQSRENLVCRLLLEKKKMVKVSNRIFVSAYLLVRRCDA